MPYPGPPDTTRPDPVVIALPGEIDVTSAADVEQQLRSACAAGVVVVADLGSTRFCDTSGFQALIAARRHAAAAGAELRAVIPPGTVRRLAGVLGLDAILPVFAGISAALAGHGCPAPPVTRDCEACGAAFRPSREHARFCSPGCRITTTHASPDAMQAAGSALRWSVAAMSQALAQLGEARAATWTAALPPLSEAVWRITIVDATMVRHHPGAYASALQAMAPPDRRQAEDTLAGLRYVRNRIGSCPDDPELARPPDASPPAAGRPLLSAWAWVPMPQPCLTALPEGRLSWEAARHRAYQDCLAGHAVIDALQLCAHFLVDAASAIPA